MSAPAATPAIFSTPNDKPIHNPYTACMAPIGKRAVRGLTFTGVGPTTVNNLDENNGAQGVVLGQTENTIQ
jgi:hypothetical protein